MTTAEVLESLRLQAHKDKTLREELLRSETEKDPIRSFCETAAAAGFPISPMELITYGEESYAAMRRSTNGGGENSPLLEWEDDYYELFMAEMKQIRQTS